VTEKVIIDHYASLFCTKKHVGSPIYVYVIFVSSVLGSLVYTYLFSVGTIFHLDRVVTNSGIYRVTNKCTKYCLIIPQIVLQHRLPKHDPQHPASNSLKQHILHERSGRDFHLFN